MRSMGGLHQRCSTFLMSQPNQGVDPSIHPSHMILGSHQLILHKHLSGKGSFWLSVTIFACQDNTFLKKQTYSLKKWWCALTILESCQCVMRWKKFEKWCVGGSGGEKSSVAIMGKMKTFLNFVQGGSNYYNEYNFLPCCNVPFESIEVGSCETLC